MLNTRPVGTHQVSLSLWDKTKNTRLELLLKGWQQANPNSPLPSLAEAPYHEWGNFKGQRRADGRKHGVVRETQPNGHICEGTYKDDQRDGLALIWSTHGEFYAYFCKNGSYIG